MKLKSRRRGNREQQPQMRIERGDREGLKVYCVGLGLRLTDRPEGWVHRGAEKGSKEC